MGYSEDLESEPPRLCRRFRFLRGRLQDKTDEVLPGGRCVGSTTPAFLGPIGYVPPGRARIGLLSTPGGAFRHPTTIASEDPGAFHAAMRRGLWVRGGVGCGL